MHQKHSTEMEIILLEKNRKFSVHIDKLSSDIKTINFSMHQSSILGPVLYNFYVSTLMKIIPKTEENVMSGYADNHTLINSLHLENIDFFLNNIITHYLH